MARDERAFFYVYGAQTTAYGIVQALEASGQPVAGYVVTRREGNPSALRGKPVLCIDELNPADRPKFLLAVPEYLHEEITGILEARGFHDHACMDAGLEYRLMRDYYTVTGKLGFLAEEEGGMGDVTEDGVEIYVAESVGDKPLRGTATFPGGSVTVQAGAAISPRILGTDFRDDAGENISCRNPHYDELTVTYWAWKNSRAPVKGIAHYRRCIALTAGERKALLEGAVDVVLPLPFLCWPDTRMQYGRYNRPEAVEAMLEAVRAVHGKRMGDTAEKVLQGDLLYNYNMLVARREAFDAYCAWMFPVLERVEECHRSMFPKGEHTRICGHLGELLETIYFRANAGNLRIVHGKKVWFV